MEEWVASASRQAAARERAIAHLVKAIGWADSAERESLAARVRSGVEDDRPTQHPLPATLGLAPQHRLVQYTPSRQ